MKIQLSHFVAPLALSLMLVCAATAWPLTSPWPETTLAQVEATDAFSVGPLRLGLGEAEARTTLGDPENQTEPQFEEATALYSKQWLYPQKGVGVVLESEERGGPFTVRTILMEEPCSWEGTSGLKIGMPEATAREILAGLVGQGVSTFEVGHEEDAGVLFEDKYIVLSVRCLDGVVKHFYLGPGPE